MNVPASPSTTLVHIAESLWSAQTLHHWDESKPEDVAGMYVTPLNLAV